MLQSYRLKEWLSWPLIRAHLCTVAVAVSFNATWKVPREGFRYGGLGYGLLLSVALLFIALPVTLLQLAIGQLSQQDAVGVWRAVPFFRGVGFIRLLISFLGSVYSVIYLSLTTAYFLYSATHTIPFPDCIEWLVEEEESVSMVNASQCLSDTFMSPVSERPEYYLAIAFITIVLWIVSPFVFYNPVKLMKRIMYVLAPLIITLGVVILSCIGDSWSLSLIVSRSDWAAFTEPHLWMSAVVQALWSCQIAGGYLISAGDSVYASTNVHWTSIAIVGANFISSWFWMMFWFGVGGKGERDTSIAAVLVQVYQATEEDQLYLAWPLLVFLTLIISGVITVLTLLYPFYDRIRRVSGVKWRQVSFASAVAGAGVTLAVLAGNLPVLTLMEDVAVPLLICLATVLEILAFNFIYGWKTLIEDIEFLSGSELAKYWVWGWWLAPAVVTPVAAWWLTALFIDCSVWTDRLWEASTVLATAVLSGIILVLFAGIAVGKQVQYDICGKLKSSFQPSRHWGPRDPITHYYWLARREDMDRGNSPRTRYNRRELGQLSRRPSFLTITDSIPSKDCPSTDVKLRSNSDDLIYTFSRKEQLTDLSQYANERKRSKSLDWDIPIRKSLVLSKSRESVAVNVNNNTVGFKYRNKNEWK